MVEVYRRGAGARAPAVRNEELEQARVEIARLQHRVEEQEKQLRAQAARDLQAKIRKAHQYAQRAKVAATHWYAEAHRLAELAGTTPRPNPNATTTGEG